MLKARSVWKAFKHIVMLRVMTLLAGNITAAIQCYVARGDILNEKQSFNIFPGEAEVKRYRNFKNLWALYLYRHTLHHWLTL